MGIQAGWIMGDNTPLWNTGLVRPIFMQESHLFAQEYINADDLFFS